MKNTTTGLTETLLETMDVQNFIKNIREFDVVTQKQCLLRARRELLRPRISSLHGPEMTKNALTAIRAALDNTGAQN